MALTKEFDVHGQKITLPAELVNEYEKYCGPFTNTTATYFVGEKVRNKEPMNQIMETLTEGITEEISIYKNPDGFFKMLEMSGIVK